MSASMDRMTPGSFRPDSPQRTPTTSQTKHSGHAKLTHPKNKYLRSGTGNTPFPLDSRNITHTSNEPEGTLLEQLFAAPTQEMLQASSSLQRQESPYKRDTAERVLVPFHALVTGSGLVFDEVQPGFHKTASGFCHHSSMISLDRPLSHIIRPGTVGSLIQAFSATTETNLANNYPQQWLERSSSRPITLAAKSKASPGTQKAASSVPPIKPLLKDSALLQTLLQQQKAKAENITLPEFLRHTTSTQTSASPEDDQRHHIEIHTAQKEINNLRQDVSALREELQRRNQAYDQLYRQHQQTVTQNKHLNKQSSQTPSQHDLLTLKQQNESLQATVNELTSTLGQVQEKLITNQLQFQQERQRLTQESATNRNKAQAFENQLIQARQHEQELLSDSASLHASSKQSTLQLQLCRTELHRLQAQNREQEHQLQSIQAELQQAHQKTQQLELNQVQQRAVITQQKGDIQSLTSALATSSEQTKQAQQELLQTQARYHQATDAFLKTIGDNDTEIERLKTEQEVTRDILSTQEQTNQQHLEELASLKREVEYLTRERQALKVQSEFLEQRHQSELGAAKALFAKQLQKKEQNLNQLAKQITQTAIISAQKEIEQLQQPEDKDKPPQTQKINKTSKQPQQLQDIVIQLEERETMASEIVQQLWLENEEVEDQLRRSQQDNIKLAQHVSTLSNALVSEQELTKQLAATILPPIPHDGIFDEFIEQIDRLEIKVNGLAHPSPLLQDTSTSDSIKQLELIAISLIQQLESYQLDIEQLAPLDSSWQHKEQWLEQLKIDRGQQIQRLKKLEIRLFECQELEILKSEHSDQMADRNKLIQSLRAKLKQLGKTNIVQNVQIDGFRESLQELELQVKSQKRTIKQQAEESQTNGTDRANYADAARHYKQLLVRAKNARDILERKKGELEGTVDRLQDALDDDYRELDGQYIYIGKIKPQIGKLEQQLGDTVTTMQNVSQILRSQEEAFIELLATSPPPSNDAVQNQVAALLKAIQDGLAVISHSADTAATQLQQPQVLEHFRQTYSEQSAVKPKLEIFEYDPPNGTSFDRQESTGSSGYSTMDDDGPLKPQSGLQNRPDSDIPSET